MGRAPSNHGHGCPEKRGPADNQVRRRVVPRRDRRRTLWDPDLELALQTRRAGERTLLLAHQPKAVHRTAGLNIDLQLSGHTHAGQVWPMNYVVSAVQPFLVGLHRKGPTQVYVNPGSAYWGPPLRIGSHPEVTMVRLRRG